MTKNPREFIFMVTRAFLDYAGMEGNQPRGFQMPGNTDFLREMADAFNAIADDIDRHRRGPTKKNQA
jgi:hypothetical protein